MKRPQSERKLKVPEVDHSNNKTHCAGSVVNDTQTCRRSGRQSIVRRQMDNYSLSRSSDVFKPQTHMSPTLLEETQTKVRALFEGQWMCDHAPYTKALSLKNTRDPER